MSISFKKIVILILILTAFVGVSVYTSYDNNRFVIIRQDVVIPGLPQTYDGFTILQITDLHGHRFGEGQKDLVSGINLLEYDMIAITGDIQDHRVQDLEPFYELMNGIENKDLVFCTAGNSGPTDVDYSIGVVTDAGKVFQSIGCRLLDRPVSIERDGERLWFAEKLYALHPDDLMKLGVMDRITARTVYYVTLEENRAKYRQEIDGILAGIPDDDVLIGITHIPLTKKVLDNPERTDLPHFDLVLAGHYHGGQIRLPFIGALVVPNPLEEHRGLFPDQWIVSGLYNGNGIQQYTSRGLGAGGPIPAFRFRFLNTPEINLITLHVE